MTQLKQPSTVRKFLNDYDGPFVIVEAKIGSMLKQPYWVSFSLSLLPPTQRCNNLTVDVSNCTANNYIKAFLISTEKRNFKQIVKRNLKMKGCLDRGTG